MTNHTLPDPGATLPPELLALAPVGGKRRPVKVVEHPAFRPYRARVALDVRFTVIRVPVVSLNRDAPSTECARLGSQSTLPATFQEAA
jgi:hypothetical protein